MDTTPAEAPPDDQPPRITHPDARSHRNGSGRIHPRRLVVSGLAVAATLVAVAACSGGTSTTSSSGASADSGGMAAGQRGSAQDLAPPHAFAAAPAAGRVGPASKAARGAGSLDLSVSQLDRAQIKTASIGLTSSKVGTVVTQVEGVATSQGGFVDSEDTRTNTHGVATSSLITIKVPVANFDSSVTAVAGLGQLSSKKVTTQDVTGQVADVASRVTSAKDSIAQLRVLFSHATKLGDIITLESELSTREADLEALQAQQRALTEQTSLSTIAVQVTRPPTTVSHVKHNDTASGFLGGLQQGWDALVATFTAVSHGLGAVLPLGLAVALIGGLSWLVVRRLPRHRADASG